MKNFLERIVNRLINISFIKSTIEKKYHQIIFKIEYNEDGLITRNIPHFLYSEKFKNAYKKGEEIGAWSNFSMRWRAYTCCWAANQALKLEGDFVELGVDKAGLSSAIVSYVDFRQVDKKLFLVDSFDGIPLQYVTKKEKQINDPNKWNKKYGDTYNLVLENFKDFENVHLIKGIIPDVLPEITAEKICFMSIDLNNAYPEIEGVKYFWDKIVKHGIIVLDDYAHGEKFAVQREEWDKFARSKGQEILNIPTGQGILIKNS